MSSVDAKSLPAVSMADVTIADGADLRPTWAGVRVMQMGSVVLVVDPTRTGWLVVVHCETHGRSQYVLESGNEYPRDGWILGCRECG